MDKIRKEVEYQLCEWAEIPKEINSLLKQAEQNAIKAYAPYSGFNVGAALLLEDGTIVNGSNQENAAYPSGLCAERVAIFSAGANYPNLGGRHLAIIVLKSSEHLIKAAAPCGACLQSLLEYEQRFGQPLQVWLGAKEEIIHFSGIDNLLPFSFDKNLL